MNDNLPVNIKIIKTETTGNVPVVRVLTSAITECLRNVVVIGYDKNDEMYFASSDNNLLTLWLLEAAKQQLINGELQE